MHGFSVRLAVVTLGVAVSGVATAAAHATPDPPECVGDTDLGGICVVVDPSGLPTVDPTGGPPVTDCVFVGPPPCMNVSVPTPGETPGADPWVVETYCFGEAFGPCDFHVAVPPLP